MSEPTPEPVAPTEPTTEPTEPTTEPEPVAPTEPAEGDEEPAEVEQPGEAAPSPAEPQAHDDEERTERLAKITRSFNTYKAAVERNMEEEIVDLLQCPLCFATDHPAFLNKHGAGRVPDEIKELVLFYLGIAREMEYPSSSKYRTCDECQGTGRVTTGSRVAGQENIGCGTCNERGWIGPEIVQTNGHHEPAPGLTAPLPAVESGATDDVDEWNEPRILPDGRQNPNFGRMPHRKIQVEPWGVTAGLTAQDAVTAG